MVPRSVARRRVASLYNPAGPFSIDWSEALGKVFDSVDRDGDGRLGKRDELLKAFRLVEENLNRRLGLDGDVLERLVEQVSHGDDASFVRRDDFVNYLKDVAVCVEGLDGLSLNELREVLIHAFQKFDTNGDGAISVCELEAAMTAMGVPMSSGSAFRLHRILGLDKVDLASLQSGDLFGQGSGADASALMRWSSAFQVAMQAQMQRKSLDKAAQLVERIKEATKGAKDPLEMARRTFDLFCKYADEMADFVEFGVDASAIFLAVNGLHEALESAGTPEFDYQSMLAFMTFLGVSGLRMYEEVVGDEGLSADESRIFVKAFQNYDFKPSQMTRLIRRTRAQFRRVEPGTAMDDILAGNIVMLVRGGVHLKDAADGAQATFGSGATFGAPLFATGESLWNPGDLVSCSESGALCLAFELETLQAELQRDEATSLKFQSLLNDSMHNNCKTVHAASRLEDEGVVCTGSRCAALMAEYEQKNPLRPTLQHDVQSAMHQLSDFHCESKEDKELANSALELLQRMADEGGGARQHDAAADFSRPLTLEGALDKAFEVVDEDKDGKINEQEAACALRFAHKQYGATTRQFVDVSKRIVAYLCADGSGLVDRASFVTGMKDLVYALESMGSISFEQLGSIIELAHNRFDADGDGHIDDEEFAAAVAALGFDIPAPSVRALYGLLSVDVGEVDPQVCKMLNALQGAMELQARRKNLDKVVAAAKGSQKKDDAQAGDSPFHDWLKQIQAPRSDELQDFLEVGMDAAAFGTALSVLQREIAGLDSWADLDIANLAPFLIFMGLSAVYIRRELVRQDVKDLSADEAVVHALALQKNGFSVQEFRDLVRDGGAVWEDVECSRRVNTWTTNEFSIVVRGQRACNGPQVSPAPEESKEKLEAGDIIGEAALLKRMGTGGSSGDEVVIAAGTRLLTWKVEALQQHLAKNEVVAQKVRRLCANATTAKTMKIQRRRKMQLTARKRKPASSGSRSSIFSRLRDATEASNQGRQSVARTALADAIQEMLAECDGGLRKAVPVPAPRGA